MVSANILQFFYEQRIKNGLSRMPYKSTWQGLTGYRATMPASRLPPCHSCQSPPVYLKQIHYLFYFPHKLRLHFLSCPLPRLIYCRIAFGYIRSIFTSSKCSSMACSHLYTAAFPSDRVSYRTSASTDTKILNAINTNSIPVNTHPVFFKIISISRAAFG